MDRRGSRALWIIAGLLSALTVAAVVVDPAQFARQDQPDELESLLETAVTYYEFEHYARAAATYAEAVELGMDRGVDWYRYARSLSESDGLDLASYVTAYRLLLEQEPYHEFLTLVEAVLMEYATPFSYEEAEAGAYKAGTLMVASGAVFRVQYGRSTSGTDTLFVDTRPHDWFGYMGNPVRIVAPKSRLYQSGDTVTAIGWYDGWCEVSDDAGLSRAYPCIIAAGVVPNS